MYVTAKFEKDPKDSSHLYVTMRPMKKATCDLVKSNNVLITEKPLEFVYATKSHHNKKNLKMKIGLEQIIVDIEEFIQKIIAFLDKINPPSIPIPVHEEILHLKSKNGDFDLNF